MSLFAQKSRCLIIKQVPTVLLALCVGVSGAALLITPSIRLAENIDSGPLNERNEKSSSDERICSEKRIGGESQQAKFAVYLPSNNMRLESYQVSSCHVFDGHRLMNGLLAPMTC